MSPGATPDVLYVTYDGLLEPLGASQVLPYVRGLARRGFSLGILSFEKPDDLARAGAVEALEAELAADGVAWARRRYHRRPTLPATGWDVLAGRRLVARWARRRRAPGIVHARGYLPGAMALAAGDRGAPHRILFDMRGFWVDERVEGGYWDARGPEAALGRRVERTVLAAADHVVLLTRRAAGHLPRLAGGAEPPPWTVVPTCVDLDRFAPRPPEAARKALGLGSGPVLIHTGTVTGWYDGPTTMRVGRAFEERTGGRFVVLTRDEEQAQALAAEAGARPVIRRASPEEVPAWLAAADAGLALVRPGVSKEASFPTKVGEYLAAGLAVLATPVGDLPALARDDVLRLLELGAPDVDGAVAWLAGAAGEPGRVAAARGLAERHLGLEEGVERLAEVYRGLGVRPAAHRRGAS